MNQINIQKPCFIFPSIFIDLPLHFTARGILSWVFNYHDKGGSRLSRKQIAKEMNYSYATINRNIAELQKAGYLMEINNVFWVNLEKFTQEQTIELMGILEQTKNDRNF